LKLQRRDTHIHQRPLLIDKLHCRQPRPACERSLGCHAIFRRFVAVFLAVRGFFRAVAAVIFPLATAPTGDGNSRLGCFAVRWWPWCTGWMRAASSAIRSSVSLRFRRSSSRYIGIVLVVMVPVWQNYLRPSWPILATRTTHWPPRGGRLWRHIDRAGSDPPSLEAMLTITSQLATNRGTTPFIDARAFSGTNRRHGC
jgi:hypothetical protein